jgi:predicted nuclease of predicted toxin-antitoxin system
MKFLVDAQLPPQLARALVLAGHLMAVLAPDASDREVVQRAASEARVVISKDAEPALIQALEGGATVVELR